MKRAYFLLIALILSATAQAEPLTLERCRTMAIEHNLNLRSSIERVASAEDIAKAYRSNTLPNFSATASYLYSTANLDLSVEGGYLPTFLLDQTTGEIDPILNQYAYMPDQNFKFEMSSIFVGGLTAVQPIYMGGKVATATALSRIGIDVAKAELRKSRVDVITLVDGAFYSYLKVEEMVESAKRYQEVVVELMRQTESAHRNGMCTTSDKMKVQVKLTEAELMLRKAENGLLLARMNLCYAIGLPLTTREISLHDDFDMNISIDSENLDITARPEYDMLQQQIEAKRLEVKLTKSDFMPQISALASAGYGYGMKLNGVNLLNEPTFAAGVMVNIPIFHWGEGRRKVSSSRRQIDIAQNTLDDISQLMTLELMQAINRYDESLLEVEFAIRNVTEVEESMRLSQSQYNAGMETIADYLEAQALWQQAMSTLTEAKASQRIAYTNYRRCAGLD